MTNEHYEALKGMVKAAATQYIRSASGFAEVEDLEQEIWIALIPHLDKFNPAEGVLITTFAFQRIQDRCKNLVRDGQRRQRRLSSLDASKNGSDGEEEATLHDEICDDTNLAQDDAIHFKLIEEKLKENFHAELVEMLRLDAQGLTAVEIAKNTNSTPVRVQRALHRAREKMTNWNWNKVA